MATTKKEGKGDADEQMNIVMVGHVDHGKSTVVGRLLADTHSLPEGKLEQVKAYCKKNAKTFEYAFLLDALKDEQAQGVTIDSARCFFTSPKREYIIIDAPGHIEFLKNMISGAARAEAAVLVIDADEGVQENSQRHAYMLSLLGITQVLVAVNKMDLVDYDEKRYDEVKEKFTVFLETINLSPTHFTPISAREGENIAKKSRNLSWYDGPCLLDAIDEFTKEAPPEDKAFRMPVQGVYKFTNYGDDRRIIAGRVETGTLTVGDKILFLPSYKTSTVKSIEEFNLGKKERVRAGESTGFTLAEQVFATRGEIVCKADEAQPHVGRRFNASIFWMGTEPLTTDKEYKLKLGTVETTMRVTKITNVLNSSSLERMTAPSVERHAVAECTIETKHAIAYDTFAEMKATGRFVIVDEYEIRGGGIITEALADEETKTREQIVQREEKWEQGSITFKERALKYGQFPTLLLVTGPTGVDKKSIAKTLERKLFDQGRSPYFLGIGNLLRGLDADIDKEARQEHVRRLGEVANILLDAGLIVIATASDLTIAEIRLLRTLITKNFMITAVVGSFENGRDIVDAYLDETDDDEANANKLIGLLAKNTNIFTG